MSAIGFKYNQSEKARSIGGGQEVCACLSSEKHDAAVSYGINTVMSGVMMETKPAEETAQPLRKSPGGENGVLQSFSQMRYIVRRLTPKEAERLMGLPDGYTIPTGLAPTDALVAEFQRIFDTFGAIMAEYEHTNPPKPKSANQVRAWLEKISNAETCPDSPRYKACGNGWATNQPRWILTRLLVLGEGIDPFTGDEL